MSHYRVLGVPQGATRAEIRAAYVAEARTAHPDLHREDGPAARRAAVDRMCAVNEAWRVLGDPSRRKVYDRYRVAVAAGAKAPPPGPRPQPKSTHEDRPERVPGRAPSGGQGSPLVFLPAGVMVLAVAQLVAGLLIGVPGLLTSGAVTFGISVAAFAAAPLLMLATSRSGRRSALG